MTAPYFFIRYFWGASACVCSGFCSGGKAATGLKEPPQPQIPGDLDTTATFHPALHSLIPVDDDGRRRPMTDDANKKTK
jgi:hypothetical protein